VSAISFSTGGAATTDRPALFTFMGDALKDLLLPGFSALVLLTSALGSPSDTDAGGLRYVRIPEGEIWMGCVPDDAQCDAHERPRHRVRLTKPYWMSTTEVTVGAFRRFVRASGFRTFAEREGRGRMINVARDQWEWISGLSWERPLDPAQPAPDDWPVAQVVPQDAESYCQWAGGRLPTEAEWERAARGGRDDERFPWGNTPLPRVAGRFFANGPDEQTKRRIPQWQTFAGYDDGFAMLAPVARFAPNPYGLYDMAGNVYEWSADRYDATAYAHGSRTDPQGPASGDSRVVRGGGWGYYPYHLRSSFRGFFPDAGFPTATVGFRCVVRDDALRKR
jgi:formylglycine-generating enzyme required for sulfatase activity